MKSRLFNIAAKPVPLWDACQPCRPAAVSLYDLLTANGAIAFA
jgi:hypothetical protein